MRALPAVSVALLLAAACTSTAGDAKTAPSPAPTQQQAARAAEPATLAPYYGSYRAADGRVFIVARLGWFFDLQDSAYRTVYEGSAPNRFTIGTTFAVPLPKFADLVFDAGTLTIATADSSVVARRVEYRQTDVAIPAGGATLAGTVTEPLGAAPHPGIVVVHGSEPGERYFYDVWVGVYAGLGLTVLTYDKRGLGSSTGRYPGESATDQALQTFADDASSALAFLQSWPGVDRARVGFHGGSQGGWTVPLAINRHGRAAFAILVSAPAVTVGQVDVWQNFSGDGAFAPTASAAEMDAAVRAGRSGYNPGPALAALRVPTLWLLGSHDRLVPTLICAEVLAGMKKPNFTVRLLPTGHGLLVNPTGLAADDDRSPGLAPELVPTIAAWLKTQ